MNAEHGVVHNSREAQAVKDVRAVAPHIRVAVLFEALVVEAVHLRDLPRLVVTSEQGDAVVPSSLHRDNRAHRLDGIVTSVHVIAQEEIVRLRRPAANLEQLALPQATGIVSAAKSVCYRD